MPVREREEVEAVLHEEESLGGNMPAESMLYEMTPGHFNIAWFLQNFCFLLWTMRRTVDRKSEKGQKRLLDIIRRSVMAFGSKIESISVTYDKTVWGEPGSEGSIMRIVMKVDDADALAIKLDLRRDMFEGGVTVCTLDKGDKPVETLVDIFNIGFLASEKQETDKTFEAEPGFEVKPPAPKLVEHDDGEEEADRT